MIEHQSTDAIRSAYFEATSQPGLSIAEFPTATGITYLVAFDGQLLGNVSLHKLGYFWWAYPADGSAPGSGYSSKLQAAESLRVHVTDTPEVRVDIRPDGRQDRGYQT